MAESNYDADMKQCPLCEKMIENLPEHYETCADTVEHTRCEASMALPTSQVIQLKRRGTRDCILCFKPIAEEAYADHVQECLSEPTNGNNSQATSKRSKDSCFNCSSPANLDNGSGCVIPCRSRHAYCLRCLRNSMHGFLASRSAPMCHVTWCNYELSRHDLSSIPLEQRVYRRLLPLVQTHRRPQCPRCHFYIELDNMTDLDQHIESCTMDNMIPCEFCHCPQAIAQLDEHSLQCRNDPTSRRHKLIEFLLPRTKHPFSAQQINFFVEKRKNSNLPIDAYSIIEALAEFEDVFPMELPTRDCVVCMESCLYDEFFVFGCSDSHKLCYKCYEQSCTTKMNNNEVLTCGLCPYQLQYGELKQLRVSPDQQNLFIEYQVQKTFDCFAKGTRALIKCPNRECKWAFEPRNPNERFCVTCHLCAKEFCSLCNQQYHFRTRCEQLVEMTQRWFFWCNTERGRYLANRARQDSAYAAQLADYERQHNANQQRNNELRRRYDEAMADEGYKAQNCRLCPHCKRVVQHMGGCSSMVCGQDYHGGNNQSGCGKQFTWEQAKPYAATAAREPKQVMHDLPRPESQVVVHENITCDGCHEIVRGIRFDCVHCPSLIYCEKCEQQCTLTHSNENRQVGQQQHVFQLIMQPLDEITSLQLTD